jgi:hypothetical protein
VRQQFCSLGIQSIIEKAISPACLCFAGLDSRASKRYLDIEDTHMVFCVYIESGGQTIFQGGGGT